MAERTDRPGVNDYGVPIAAVARHRGEMLEHQVYDGAYAARLYWCICSNLTVAVTHLEVSNVSVNLSCE